MALRMFSRLISYLLFSAVRPMIVKREMRLSESAEAEGADLQAPSHAAGANLTTFAVEDYFEWRGSELRQQFKRHFDIRSIGHRDILDFGCGSGHLSFFLAASGAKSVEGIDLNVSDIEFAVATGEKLNLNDTLTFRIVSDTKRVEAPREAFDVITCFDVLEHIEHLPQIVLEWARVLRPGGRILIWWQPYYHPFGHHLMSYLPLPWVHVLFSRKTLAAVCNRIFLMPEYKGRFWEIDEHGNKRKDRLFSEATVMNSLNGLTISKFERLCSASGLVISRREAHAFTGRPAVTKISSALSKVAFAREFMTAYMIYELEKPQYS